MTRITKLKNGKLSAEFDGVYDAMRVVRQLGWTPQQEQASDSRRGGGDDDFYTFGSLTEALNVFEHNPESIRQFSVNDDRIERIESPGKDVMFDVTGDYLDIDKFLMGEPEHFGNAVMGNPNNVFCTINVLTSFVWYTSPEYQLQKQKRILRIVDWLETQGVRCQIVAQDDSDVSFISTVVKQYQDPFNLNELAVVCHPDWLRRFEFLVMEQSDTWESGYGSSSAYDRKMLKYVPQPEDGVYVYIGGYEPYGGWGSNDIKKLNEEFDKLEVKLQALIEDGRTWNDEPFTIGR
jgi:hypothetical protein